MLRHINIAREEYGCEAHTVHEGCERVVYVNGENLPVRLLSLQKLLDLAECIHAGSGTHVSESETSKDLDLLDLANVTGTILTISGDSQPPVTQRHLLVANVNNINWVVVTRVPRKLVVKVGALPRLGDGPVEEGVALVRPYALHKPGLIFLFVMKDGI